MGTLDGLAEGMVDGAPEGEMVGASVSLNVRPGVGLSLGASVGLADAKTVGDALGAGDFVGPAEGDVVGDLVGGSVFKIQRFFKARVNVPTSKAWIGRTPLSLPGLSSTIHKADPCCTSLAAPTPIAKRWTFNAVRAAISESYWVAALEFSQSFPRTQFW